VDKQEWAVLLGGPAIIILTHARLNSAPVLETLPMYWFIVIRLIAAVAQSRVYLDN
jgi:hypothetical protein